MLSRRPMLIMESIMGFRLAHPLICNSLLRMVGTYAYVQRKSMRKGPV